MPLAILVNTSLILNLEHTLRRFNQNKKILPSLPDYPKSKDRLLVLPSRGETITLSFFFLFPRASLDVVFNLLTHFSHLKTSSIL